MKMWFMQLLCVLNKWIHYSFAFTWAFIKFTFWHCLNVSSIRVGCDVNDRLYHTCYVPPHGSNRKPASARISHDSCHAQEHSLALFTVHLIFILSVFKLFIFEIVLLKYTIYFFTCVDDPFAFNPVVYCDRTQLTGVDYYLLRTLPDI